MEKIDEREMQKTTKEIQVKQKGARGTEAVVKERVRTNWFCFPFKLGLLQLICKASLIFKSNIELTLSIILKQENYMSQILLQKSVDV